MSSKKKPKHTKGQGVIYPHPRSPFLYMSYWNGKVQKRVSTKTDDPKEALAKLRAKLEEVSQNHQRAGEDIDGVTVNALFGLLVDTYRREDHADLYNAELRIGKHLGPAFGTHKAAKVSTSDVSAYIKTRRTVAMPATINRELALLHRAYILGAEHQPPLVRAVLRVPKLKEDNVRDGFMEEPQYRSLLAALCTPVQPVFVVAYHLGMRTGELLKIQRDWVDLAEGVIYMLGRVTKNKKPKTAPIYGDMRPWLEMQLTRCQTLSPNRKELFVWEDGTPIRDFRGSWEAARVAAGVPELLFHDLRRTAVRNMIRAGVPEKVAMEISGHKTAAMLWRYNITDTRDVVEAGRKTERYLQEKRASQLAQSEGIARKELKQ